MRIPTRRCRLGFLRFRIWSSRRARVVEAARQPWNKVLRPSFHLVVTRSGAGDGLVGFVLVGFGAPDLDEPCTRVCCRQAWPAALREVTSGEAVRFADVRFDGLVLPSPVLWQDCQVKAQVSAGRVPGRWPFTVLSSSRPWRDSSAALVKASVRWCFPGPVDGGCSSCFPPVPGSAVDFGD